MTKLLPVGMPKHWLSLGFQLSVYLNAAPDSSHCFCSINSDDYGYCKRASVASSSKEACRLSKENNDNVQIAVNESYQFVDYFRMFC